MTRAVGNTLDQSVIQASAMTCACDKVKLMWYVPPTSSYHLWALLSGGLSSYQLLLGDIAYCSRRYYSMVCLSVCLSRSCIVLKWHKISTRFSLARNSSMSRTSWWSPPVVQIGSCYDLLVLASVSSGICSVWPNREKRHARTIVKRCSWRCGLLKMRFEIMIVLKFRLHCWLPMTSPSPKWGSQMHCAAPTLRRVLPPDEYDRREMSPIAKLLCTWSILLD